MFSQRRVKLLQSVGIVGKVLCVQGHCKVTLCMCQTEGGLSRVRCGRDREHWAQLTVDVVSIEED